MDILVIIFLVFGLAAMVVAFMIEGGQLIALVSLTGFLIVIGGTVAAVGVSFPKSDIMRVPALFKIAFTDKKFDMLGLIKSIKSMSKIAREKGILSLEKEINENTKIDSFTKRGLGFILDGLDPIKTREALELDLQMMSYRHKSGAAMFDAAGGYAPTMGIIGTVMGLISVLGDLADPSGLGESIAVAFIATLYGVGSANILWLPLASNLKSKSKKEIVRNSMIIEGLLLIQEGANPNFIEDKLKSYLSKDDLKQKGSEKQKDPKKAVGKAKQKINTQKEA
ncbi:flagellar motor protein [Acetobacterium sp.]|uniref:flagellar motor protein n=1 Tax=Acetobacterium sp. TaxID=1872094 RepID=UPI002F3ECFA8